MAHPILSIHPSAARTASGYTGTVDVNRFSSCDLSLVISAASGTDETLDVTVEQSQDGSNFVVTDTYAQAVGTGTALKQNVRVSGNVMRIHYVIGGTTPSFTSDVRGSFKK